MAWRDQWDPEDRGALEKLAGRLGARELHRVSELTAKGSAKTYLVRPIAQTAGLRLIVVKLAPYTILQRIARGQAMATITFNTAVVHSDLVKMKRGNSCAYARFEGDGTFGEIYPTADERRVVAIIRSLMAEALGTRATPTSVDEKAFDLYQFSPEVERELRVIGADPTVMAWWNRARTLPLHSSWRVPAHGDLNCGNVLVSGTRAQLIDVEHGDYLHVMDDPAKLERDICLRLCPESDREALLEVIFDDRESRRSLQSDPVGKALRAVDALRDPALDRLRSSFKLGGRAGDIAAFEYRVALLAHYMRAAANVTWERKSRVLAARYVVRLRSWLEEHEPILIMPEEEIRPLQRAVVLRKLALAFLTLDQLPHGGWSKTLAGWMEALWEGDVDDRIARNPDMRTAGGTDLTCYALYHYGAFMRACGRRPHARVAGGALDAIVAKASANGAIGSSPRGTKTRLNLRHTIMGLLVFVVHGQLSDGFVVSVRQIEKAARFLKEHLGRWEEDDSHLFGMLASAVKLCELMSIHPLDGTKKLIPTLRRAIVGMRKALKQPARYEARPLRTSRLHPDDPYFKPYGGFWRMKRSNFLMYLPFLISEGGKHMRSGAASLSRKDDWLLVRCAHLLRDLLRDVDAPFRADQPEHSLLRYHESPFPDAPDAAEVKRDWGLSAELVAVLRSPAVVQLLEQQGMPAAELRAKRTALDQALLATFDTYDQRPGLFAFTHGASFGRYLATVDPTEAHDEEIGQLEAAIDTCWSKGATERDIDELTHHLGDGATGWVALPAIREMLLTKLEGGEYVADTSDWNRRVDRALTHETIRFYDGPEGLKYAERYDAKPLREFVRRCHELVPSTEGRARKAIDVGCGSGQYAALLATSGFDVTLIDTSLQLLKLAAQKLGIAAPPPRDVYTLDEHDIFASSYDLCFACAMMVHVPRRRAGDVCRSFYRLLKPGGILFVNFKIQDHSLIARDGRFFEYYRDLDEVERLLRGSGFDILEMTVKWNEENMYQERKRIRWANCYCRRPLDPSAAA